MKRGEGLRVAVVGAGLGGISAAISLASEGFSVDVFEKNGQIGGKLNIGERDGFNFDLGPSILILPHIFERLFLGAGRRMEDYVTLEELSPQWRNFYEDGVVLDLCADIRDMEAQLSRFPPDASAGYFSFLEHSRTLWKFAERTYLDGAADSVRDILRLADLGELLTHRELFSTMDKGVARHVSEPHLNQMLNFFIKYVGSSSLDAPGIYNLLAYSQLGYGLWYVSGGMYNLARGLDRLMDELGVALHLNTEIREIQRSEKRVTGVACSNGEVHPADFIVCNREVIPAYRDLLGASERFLAPYERRYKPSCSGLVIHLGVNRRYPQLAHHNFFYAVDQKHHFDSVYRDGRLPEDPTIYLVAPTRTDNTLAPEGHEIIKILPHIPHLQDPPYRQSDYLLLKERLYRKLERMGLEDLRKHIVVEDMLTPDDLQRMYASHKGSIYGVEVNLKRNLGFRAPKKSRAYENLYFVGGSVNPGSGMPMVVNSGQMVCDAIVKSAGTCKGRRAP